MLLAWVLALGWAVACRSDRDPGPVGDSTADPSELLVSIDVRPGLHDLVAHTLPADVAPAWSWSVDGAATDFDGPRVPVEALDVGQHWTATATIPGASGSASVVVPEPPGGNVVVVVLDDIGVDKLAAYGLADGAPPTPTIDALAAEGVVFRQAYASSSCSPTRAHLLTGRHGRRTGAGLLVDMDDDLWELPLAALTLPEALERAHDPWTTAAIGKWHLAANASPSGLLHPNLQGFDHFAGSPGYLVTGNGTTLDGYFRWKKNVDGASRIVERYNTTDTVDDALDWLAGASEPSLLWLSFNAAHVPLHDPPAALHTRPLGPGASGADQFAAMVESLDTELGRLLDGMDPGRRARTTFIVVGDNGTSPTVMDAGFQPDRGKGTPYESGIRVPLLIAGPHVAAAAAGQRCDALVHAVDVFTTVADIAGVPLGDEGERLAVAARRPLEPGTARVLLDGKSLLPWLADPAAPGPDLVLSEGFAPNGGPPYIADVIAVRDASHKYVRATLGAATVELVLPLYGPGALDEGLDLLGPRTAEGLEVRDRLGAALDAWLADVPYEGR